MIDFLFTAIIMFSLSHLSRCPISSLHPCFQVICLAITEPYAGSDVANLQTVAKKTPDGKHYIVNGEKKWITNGVFSDFFTVAVRTGGPGMGGISLLLIERGAPGLTTKQMNCSGVWPSGTTYITFEDVLVMLFHFLLSSPYPSVVYIFMYYIYIYISLSHMWHLTEQIA